MNIFFLDENPELCAKYHCDKHCIKMITEMNQMMSTAHRVLDGELKVIINDSGRKQKRYFLNDDRESILYKDVMHNHPCTKWVMKSKKNYEYLVELQFYLLIEYSRRYSKIHGGEKLFEVISKPPLNIQDIGFTEPALAMPDDCKIPGNPVSSYRNYYIKEKSRFAKWDNTPEWFIQKDIKW